MQDSDRGKFSQLMSDAMAFYGKNVSTFALGVWWEACRNFSLEQVAKALTAHAMDPEQGQYQPKPANLVKALQGTRTDRSLIAWGKVLVAMQRVGAYTSVAFDDPVIHAAVEDLGGWAAICRGELNDLPHVERRFCESYRAYASRPDVAYVGVLPGVHQLENGLRGKESAPPILIGDPERAAAVMRNGGSAPKTQMTPAIAHVSDVPRLGNAA